MLRKETTKLRILVVLFDNWASDWQLLNSWKWCLALLHWFLHLNVKQDGLSASRHVTDRVTCSTLTDRSLPEQQSPYRWKELKFHLQFLPMPVYCNISKEYFATTTKTSCSAHVVHCIKFVDEFMLCSSLHHAFYVLIISRNVRTTVHIMYYIMISKACITPFPVHGEDTAKAYGARKN